MLFLIFTLPIFSNLFLEIVYDKSYLSNISNDKLIKLLDVVCKNIKEINKACENYIPTILDPSYFFNTLRPYLNGYGEFKKVSFEGIKEEMDYSQIKGGSAGQDPCFLALIEALGIELETNYKNIHKELENNMFDVHRNWIQYWRENCIKDYVKKQTGKENGNQLIEIFNDCVEEYALFFLKTMDLLLSIILKNQREKI